MSDAGGLPVPSTTAGREGLRAVVDSPSTALVACDYDGTLAPIVDDPSAATPAHGAVTALSALTAHVAQVAIITGRPAETAVRLGGLEAIPGLIVLGAYGAERWPPSADAAVVPAELPAAVGAEIARVVEQMATPGLSVERKGSAVAVHTRNCVDPDGTARLLLPLLKAVAQDHGLAIEPGRFVVELRRGGADKGSALRRLVDESKARSVVFVGDDLGDLAAFAEVVALRRFGLGGLCVASSSTEAPSVSAAADVVVDGPAGVVDLLRALLAAIGERPSAQPPEA